MKKELGLYVHIPFCVRKCLYCDFLSFGGREQDMARYCDALCKELAHLSPYAASYTVTSVFFGGGTPTVLPVSDIERILNGIQKNFSLSPDAEITIEGNPGTVTLADLKRLKKAGFNRVSLGVQSLSDPLLKKIGRIHSAREVLETYLALRVAGFENFNFDLMFGLPSQTTDDFRDTLEKVIKLSPPHISAYGLQLEEGTPLYMHKNEYAFPDEDAERNMYELACSMLQQAGYLQYEISNFAKAGFESRHNLKYWRLVPYLGAGLGASSFFENVRYENPSDMEAYFAHISHFRPLFREKEKQSVQELMSEFLFLGLRTTAGVCDQDFRRLFGQSFFTVYPDAIQKHLKNGLLQQDGDVLRLSHAGLSVSNYVMSDFV